MQIRLLWADSDVSLTEVCRQCFSRFDVAVRTFRLTTVLDRICASLEESRDWGADAACCDV